MAIAPTFRRVRERSWRVEAVSSGRITDPSRFPIATPGTVQRTAAPEVRRLVRPLPRMDVHGRLGRSSQPTEAEQRAEPGRIRRRAPAPPAGHRRGARPPHVRRPDGRAPDPGPRGPRDGHGGDPPARRDRHRARGPRRQGDRGGGRTEGPDPGGWRVRRNGGRDRRTGIDPRGRREQRPERHPPSEAHPVPARRPPLWGAGGPPPTPPPPGPPPPPPPPPPPRGGGGAGGAPRPPHPAPRRV